MEQKYPSLIKLSNGTPICTTYFVLKIDVFAIEKSAYANFPKIFSFPSGYIEVRATTSYAHKGRMDQN